MAERSVASSAPPPVDPEIETPMMPPMRTTRRGARACFAALAGLLVTASAAAAEESVSQKFILRDSPKPIQGIQFTDGQGNPRQLSDFHGKVILLNLWATWCVPCRKEMPALDRLQAALGGTEFQVVPLSIDRGGLDAVRKFYAKIGIQKLGMFIDTEGDANRKLAIVGLPTTLLVNDQGREIGRLIGPAEWDTAQNIEFLRCLLKNVRAERRQGSSNPAELSCGGRVVRFPAPYDEKHK